MCKYGTCKIRQSWYARFLKADLLDIESKHTIIFLVIETCIPQFVASFEVNDFVRIEGASIRKRVCNDGGTSIWALYADATILVVKAKAFECSLVLYPDHRIKDLVAESAIDYTPTIAFTVMKLEDVSIKSDGGSSFRLTIADGPVSSDRASLLFVPTRRYDYHHMVNEVNTHGSYTCVAHNMNVFKQLTNTLSIVDATILCPLPDKLQPLFKDHLSKQLTSLGFGKKV